MDGKCWRLARALGWGQHFASPWHDAVSDARHRQERCALGSSRSASDPLSLRESIPSGQRCDVWPGSLALGPYLRPDADCHWLCRECAELARKYARCRATDERGASYGSRWQDGKRPHSKCSHNLSTSSRRNLMCTSRSRSLSTSWLLARRDLHLVSRGALRRVELAAS